MNEQVRRNLDRFPKDFMFQLNQEEWNALISQFVISNEGRGGRRKPNSIQAIQMSIRIIEMFVFLREMVLLHKDVAVLVEQVENRLMKQDQKIAALFTYLN